MGISLYKQNSTHTYVQVKKLSSFTRDTDRVCYGPSTAAAYNTPPISFIHSTFLFLFMLLCVYECFYVNVYVCVFDSFRLYCYAFAMLLFSLFLSKQTPMFTKIDVISAILLIC